MALTDAEKAEIRRYLGYSDLNRLYTLPIEPAMNALSPEGETQVKGYLVDLADLQARLKAAWDRSKVLIVEDITLAHQKELAFLRSEGQRLVQDLATALSVRPLRKPFSPGPRGGMSHRG